ncbi:hypothetical protein EV700_0457 [Fluviicoccus keumensis]|uniref:HEAT repeat protein n=1 Tax=Fluviicoccus keumensis TaxID=1435465 RepID=A0A4Q7ZBF8_9GAMM|nr:HEAT repeat domain-containing protein [Fluviicoccus keumensis]RZU47494.1 hypothetical protein EV700_0457 [Fluviicoccus keumensis]
MSPVFSVRLLAGVTLTVPALLWMLSPNAPEPSAASYRTHTQAVVADNMPAPPVSTLVTAHRQAALPPTGHSDAQIMALIQRLANAGDEEGLYRIRSLLADRDSGQGLRLANVLLEQSDIRLRRVGIDLITSFSMTDPTVHQQVALLLKEEQSPELLLRLLARMDAPIDLYGTDTEISSGLHRLLTSTDNDVRSQALLQLLQWDDYATLEGYLYQALNDPSPEVRLSATTVVGLIDTRSTTLKSALLAIRDNPRESIDMHRNVITALHNMDAYEADPQSSL